MLNIKVALPGVHMAGSDAHHNAHIEVGHHGFALFLSPEAEYPVLDVNGTLGAARGPRARPAGGAGIPGAASAAPTAAPMPPPPWRAAEPPAAR